MNDLDLPEAFVDAIEHLDLPDVDLTAAVLDRISADPPDATGAEDVSPVGPGTESDPRIRRVALAGAALIVVVGLVLAATPAGQAVAAWFGIGATAFEIDDTRIDETEPDETDAVDADDADDAATLDLGQQVLPNPDIVPIASLGRPDAVFDDIRRGRTYVWNTKSDVGPLRLSARSTFKPAWSVKSLAAEEDVEFLTVEVPIGEGLSRPEPGVWIKAPHRLSYPVEGLDLELTVDSGPVLLWVHDDVELRLEGAVDKDEAIGYAVEVSEGTELLPPG